MAVKKEQIALTISSDLVEVAEVCEGSTECMKTFHTRFISFLSL